MNTEPITSFDGEYRFLSNFWPCKIKAYGFLWSCSESLYQASKTLYPKDFVKFVNLNPREAKKLGKEIEIRPDWDEIKYETMEEIINFKFDQNNDLALKLIETRERELIEGNWWGDTYWGVCKGIGENNLGKILMNRRDKIKHLETNIRHLLKGWL